MEVRYQMIVQETLWTYSEIIWSLCQYTALAQDLFTMWNFVIQL
jgi:hypothetical protein